MYDIRMRPEDNVYGQGQVKTPSKRGKYGAHHDQTTCNLTRILWVTCCLVVDLFALPRCRLEKTSAVVNDFFIINSFTLHTSRGARSSEMIQESEVVPYGISQILLLVAWDGRKNGQAVLLS